MLQPETTTSSETTSSEKSFAAAESDRRGKRIMLVGPGFRFLSGLSAYSCQFANALAESHDVSVILLDRLIPARLYPGWRRVGHDLTSLRYDPRVSEAATIDWYWGSATRRVRAALYAQRPDVIVLQWWTAATLHTYLAISRLAAEFGIPVVIEFHEVQDTGEAELPFVSGYCRRFLRRLMRRATGAIFHTRHDAELFASMFGYDEIDRLRTAVAPHGPYGHLTLEDRRRSLSSVDETTRVLSFGLIRPYKGVEDLVAAFDTMTPDEAELFEIAVVGETWESCTTPADAIAASRYRDRIRFDNRYVSDAEAAEYFANADVLVLPYRRGSASGPLQIAMNNGIFVVLYAVASLVEAVVNYDGAIVVPAGDVAGLRTALLSIVDRRGQRFADPHSWTPLVEAVGAMAEVHQ
jgi:glycosyltransferase involved in cell wall biosynthesis